MYGGRGPRDFRALLRRLSRLLLVSVAGSALLVAPSRAGTGSIDGDSQTIDLTVLLLYPPSQADIDEAKASIQEASDVLCDVTEGQVRLGKVTLRAGGCESGDCGVGLDEADIVLSPTDSPNAGISSYCAKPEVCSILGTLGARVYLSRYYLDRPVVWAHELGHYVFDLNDAYESYYCKSHRPPYGTLLPCSQIGGSDETVTSLMLAENCLPINVDYTELTTEATFPYDAGQGSDCADYDDVFGDGLCDPEDACDYDEGYDGYKNEENTLYPRCDGFDPSTCRYERSGSAWWSLFKYGEIRDEMYRVAQTMKFLNGGEDFFTSVTTGVPNPGVPANRVDFCNTNTVIDDETQAPDQVLLVLDRSGSMKYPEGECQKCCDECPDSWTPRLEKLQKTATEYLELLLAVPQEGIEAGILSFACDTELDVPIQSVTGDSYDKFFEPAIADLMAEGDTAIGDALVAAGTALGDGAGKAVLLLTDGFVNCGDQQDVAEAIADLEDAGVRVYAISFGPAAGSAEAMSIATGTNGNFVGAKRARDLPPALCRQWAALVNAGLLIPQLPYRMAPFGTTEPPESARTPSTWASGDDTVPGDPDFPLRTNTFEVLVEDGTERIIVSLAGTMDDMAEFGVKAILDGPIGPNPTMFDTDVPHPLMNVYSREYYLWFEIFAPNPGLWRIHVEGSPAFPGTVQEGFITVLSRAADQRLFTDLDRGVVHDQTEGLELTVYPRFQNGTVGAAEVTATLVRPDGSTAPLEISGGVVPEEPYLASIGPALITFQGLYEVRVRSMAVNGTAWASPGEWLPEIDVPTFERTGSRFFVSSFGPSPNPCDPCPPATDASTGPEDGGTALSLPRPTPFRGETLFHYTLGARSNVQLAIYDVVGRRVRVLTESPANAGDYTITWDARDASGAHVTAGTYFVRLTAGDVTRTRKVVYLGGR